MKIFSSRPGISGAARWLMNSVGGVMAEWRESQRVWTDSTFGSSKVRVFYGYDRLPGRHEIAQGGIVKCQDLVMRFPNQRKGANLLYLISSAYPPAALSMARKAKKQGVKIIVNQNGVAYQAWFGEGWASYNRPLAEMLGLADYVFYQSSFCRDTSHYFLGNPGVPGEILFNCVDTAIFVPVQGRFSEGPVVLAAGSHNQFYRVEAVLQSFALLHHEEPGARLILAGHLGWEASETSALNQVRALAGKLKISDALAVTGRYTQQEAVTLFHQAHILLHTKYNDPCPRLVIEAMACGLPVVYSASGGVPELVGEEAGRGVLVSTGYDQIQTPKATDMAEALREVWRHYADYSAAARHRAVLTFDVVPWLQRHSEVFNNLIVE